MQQILFENIEAVPWWPNGLGFPPQLSAQLYTAAASIAIGSAGSASTLSVSASVGFRVAHLVTGDDSTQDKRQQLLQQDGSSNFTMRIKINGANLWARGGNMIPMEELEGRQSVEAYVTPSSRNVKM
jgi:D-serine dehydratase